MIENGKRVCEEMYNVCVRVCEREREREEIITTRYSWTLKTNRAFLEERSYTSYMNL